jgi:hypothetical protein
MAEEPTTPDVVELTRRAYDASNAGDFDTMMGLLATNYADIDEARAAAELLAEERG